MMFLSPQRGSFLSILLLSLVLKAVESSRPGGERLSVAQASDKEETRRLRELESNHIIDWSEEDDMTLSTTTESHEKDKGHQGKVVQEKSHTPVVYWHGMGDNGVHVKHALRIIEEQLPDVYVKSIQIGSNIAEDTESGYFVNVNEQVGLVCEMIRTDSSLQGGYNAIGLSQGGQFLRAVAQRCPDPPMFNLISLGGQHQGIFGLPKCQAPKAEWCEIIDKLLTHVAYAGWVQKFLVQAEYWHDPFKNAEYVNNSVFLADINNERSVNESYKVNLQRLENLVLVLFEDETIVQPKQSEWFGFFEDRLGLKVMNEAGKLHFLSSPGDHLKFTDEWFIKNIIKPFLS